MRLVTLWAPVVTDQFGRHALMVGCPNGCGVIWPFWEDRAEMVCQFVRRHEARLHGYMLVH